MSIDIHTDSDSDERRIVTPHCVVTVVVGVTTVMVVVSNLGIGSTITHAGEDGQVGSGVMTVVRP